MRRLIKNPADSPIRTYVLRVFLLAAVAQFSRGFEREVFLPLQPVGLHVAFALKEWKGKHCPLKTFDIVLVFPAGALGLLSGKKASRAGIGPLTLTKILPLSSMM